MDYKSCAQWPAGTIGCDGDRSEDTHSTIEQANGVCSLLRSRGFGGDGKIFPLVVWTEQTNYQRLPAELKAAMLKALREAPDTCQIAGSLVEPAEQAEGSLDGMCYCAAGIILKTLGLRHRLLPPTGRDSRHCDVWVMEGVVKNEGYTAVADIPKELIRNMNWPLDAMLYRRDSSGARTLHAVAMLNDEYKLSLKEIADLIEEQW